MIKKPYKITKIDNNQDIERLDNLLSLLFTNIQPQEHRYLAFTGAGVWLSADDIREKELILCENTTDNERRLYTKISGTLRYIVWI